MSSKSRSAAFQGYTPGPDLDNSPAPGDQPKPARHYGTEVDPASDAANTPTYLTGRIQSGLQIGAPVQQFTPDQEFFRSSLADGRWQADYGVGAHAPVYHSRQDPITGAVDVVRLEPWHTDNGADQYLDLGGKGGIDYAAGRA